MKEAASSESKNIVAPTNSETSPNLPIGVEFKILLVRGVGVPSALNNND